MLVCVHVALCLFDQCLLPGAVLHWSPDGAGNDRPRLTVWSWRSKAQVLAGWFWGREGDAVPARSFWGLLAVPGVPWLVDMPLSAHGISLRVHEDLACWLQSPPIASHKLGHFCADFVCKCHVLRVWNFTYESVGTQLSF